MGESYGPWTMGQDHQAMPHIDMANIACGFHASDPNIMAETVACAVQHGVTIGAHPGYQDKEGFGRRSIPHTPQEITRLTLYQTGALQAICQQAGTQVSYIKPHGALYHDMMNREPVYIALLEAAAALPGDISLMIQARADNSHYQTLATRYGVPLLFEAFADRAYNSEGQLVARSETGAVYHDPEQICSQARQLAESGQITTVDGQVLPLQADTLCVHGDNLAAVAVIQRIRHILLL